jgi:hypothetical protein
MITNLDAKKDGAPPTISNPTYQAWMQQDQAIMSTIVSSLTENTLGMVLFAKTSHDVWSTLEASFASQSTARSMQIRNQLLKLKKLDL